MFNLKTVLVACSVACLCLPATGLAQSQPQSNSDVEVIVLDSGTAPASTEATPTAPTEPPPPAEADANTQSPPPAPPAEETVVEPTEGDFGHYLATTPQLTGDWWGVRTDLKDAGFDFSFLLGTMSQINFRGGDNTHNAHETGGKAFYNLIIDFDKIAGIEGATFFGRLIQTWNSGIRGDVGSLSTPFYSAGSGGDKSLELDKWWWRQRMFDDRLEFRLGKLLNVGDLFNKNAYADNYLNHFQNSWLFADPTVPSTKGLGAFVKVWPADWVYLQAMVVDQEYSKTSIPHGFGGFDTAFHERNRPRAFWEFGFLPHQVDWSTEDKLLPGNYRFGWWLDPENKKVHLNNLEGLRADRYRSGDVGAYLSFDQMVWKENADPKDNQGVGVFARYGYAHGDVNRIEHFWSLGSAWTGLIPERDKDTLGFGVAQGIMSNQYRDEIAPMADRETVYEIYYAIHVAPWLTITPDFQVITSPGGTHGQRDSWIGGLRFKIVF